MPRVSLLPMSALLAVLVAVSLDSAESLAQKPPVKGGLNRRFRFTDEKDIRKDWKLNGEYRVEGQGVRLYGEKTTLLESRWKLLGEMEITIEFEISPRRELCVSMWGETFEFKPEAPRGARGTVPAIATLARKGDAVTFRTGRDQPTIVKLQEARRDIASAVVLNMDRKSTSKTSRELLLKSVLVKAANVEQIAD